MLLNSDEYNLLLIICIFFIDDNIEIDGCLVRIRGFIICIVFVGFVELYFFSYFIIRESFCYRLLYSFNLFLFFFFRFGCKVEIINIFLLSIFFVKVN